MQIVERSAPMNAFMWCAALAASCESKAGCCRFAWGTACDDICYGAKTGLLRIGVNPKGHHLPAAVGPIWIILAGIVFWDIRVINSYRVTNQPPTSTVGIVQDKSSMYLELIVAILG